METYQLYLITNNINNKKYVGQTKTSIGYQKRFINHCKEAKYQPYNGALHNAITKYGKESFSVKLLLKDISEEKIDFYERLWINKLNTHVSTGLGYNITYGGQGTHGYKHTQESLEKMSNASKNYWVNLKTNNPEKYQELCEERSKRLKGKPKNFITRKRLSESCKERYKTNPGTFYGKKHTDETKDLISKANGHAVAMIDKNSKEIIKTFQSAKKATDWLIENGKTKNKYANCRILYICDGNDKSAYGYLWKYLEEV